MRLAQVGDFHFTRLTWNPFRLFSKRLLAQMNWLLLRKSHFYEEQMAPLPKLFEELGVDLVLMGGDFSTTALREEFEEAKKFVAKIRMPWLAIPGNHDRYTGRSCKGLHFYRYFSHQRGEIFDPIQFFTLKEHRIEVHPLKAGWHLIALDTALATNPYSSEGLFSEKLEKYLNEVLRRIPKGDAIVLMNHYPFFQNDIPRHRLIRGEALQKILENEPRIRLYLHGHTHRHTVADLQVSGLPVVLDGGSCSQGKKGAWNLIDLTDEGCQVTSYRWNHKWEKKRVEVFSWKRG